MSIHRSLAPTPVFAKRTLRVVGPQSVCWWKPGVDVAQAGGGKEKEAESTTIG